MDIKTFVLGSGTNYSYFTTIDTDLAPITLAGTPSLACNVNGGAAATAGLTLAVDSGSITGRHRVAVDVDNGTLALVDGDTVDVYLAAGTVDGISVVGQTVLRFVVTDGSLLAQTASDINAEVVDVLNVDTFAQPTQGTPAATTTLSLMLRYLYKAWRNRSTQTSSEYALYNDDGVTKDHEAACSDDATTFVRGEVSTGA